MKCLEKERTRRYETANGVAAELKRHLNNEPVVARPDGQFEGRSRSVWAASEGLAQLIPALRAEFRAW
jgi:hypothetical protein